VRTPLCERLGIDMPIFAFSHCRDVVAAVSRSGGFGVLGALAFSPSELETELDWIDEHVGGRPYGVDIVMPASIAGAELGFDPQAFEAMISRSIAASSKGSSTSSSCRSCPRAKRRTRGCSGGSMTRPASRWRSRSAIPSR